ncbi:MAG: hypothetical protein DME26_21980 [Verrucomicrobia bacterium]|nr:MAG: hypothetical protein DME26_21980 [Verrucomicrobiota bacterium]
MLAHILPNRQTPAIALIANTCVGFVTLLIFQTDKIITLSVFGALTLYALSMFAFFRLRTTAPQLDRPFVVPLYPWFPGTALVLAVLAGSILRSRKIFAIARKHSERQWPEMIMQSQIASPTTVARQVQRQHSDVWVPAFPSPRPSPLGRGRIIASRSAKLAQLVLSRHERSCQLCPRARGRGSLHGAAHVHWGHEPTPIPLTRRSGTLSPIGGEGWGEGVRFLGRGNSDRVLTPAPTATRTVEPYEPHDGDEVFSRC